MPVKFRVTIIQPGSQVSVIIGQFVHVKSGDADVRSLFGRVSEKCPYQEKKEKVFRSNLDLNPAWW